MIKIKKEFIKFLLAGLSAIGTDLVTYYILLNFSPHDIAKTISFIFGSIVAFIINKYWTFKKNRSSYGEIIKFIFLYSITLIVNIIINSSILEYTGLLFLAFLVATGISTFLNFVGQKWWVFKK
jgi:putative flippase GtrA